MITIDINKILRNQLSGIPEGKVALLLSGGVDSCSLLFTLLELKRDVVAYTFTLQGVESSDFLYAKKVCKQFNIPFNPIYLPTDITTLKNDILYLVNTLNLRKKTEIECSWAMMYAIKQIKETTIVTGLGADGHFCLSKTGLLHYSHTVEQMDEFRSMLFSKPNYAQKATITELSSLYGKTVISPFMSTEMISAFKGTSWEELNKPKQKQPILDAHPAYFNQIKIRPHTNFQLGDSGISAHFTKLLTTDWNLKHYKSVVGIYNSVVRGEITNV